MASKSKRAPELSAFKARVETYEKELQDLFKEGKSIGGSPPGRAGASKEEEERAVTIMYTQMFTYIGRRLKLTEKYEAAQREYAAALAARLEAAEKELQKFKAGLVHRDYGP
jgi:hypothetical protein